MQILIDTFIDCYCQSGKPPMMCADQEHLSLKYPEKISCVKDWGNLVIITSSPEEWSISEDDSLDYNSFWLWGVDLTRPVRPFVIGSRCAYNVNGGVKVEITWAQMYVKRGEQIAIIISYSY